MPEPMRSEAEIQRDVIRLLTLAGFVVYNTSQGYRKEPGGTRMTRGLADLILFHPILKRFGAFEVKTTLGLKLHERGILCQGQPKDILRAQGQQRFGRHCTTCGGVYAIGGMAEAWKLLESLGLAEPEATSITGYRLRVPRETR
jgi:hypothetical protein